MHRRIVLSLVMALLFSGTASAESQAWDVYYGPDQAFVNVIISGFESDTLHFVSAAGAIAVPQDSLHRIVKRNAAHPEIGILGMVAGTVIGGATAPRQTGLAALFSPVEIVGRALVGGLLGGVIGTVFGSSMGADKVYRLDEMSPEQKRKLLTRLFSHVRTGRRPVLCPTCPGE